VWKAVSIFCMVAACYAPIPPEGRACGEGGACPLSLTCQRGVCVRDVDPSPDGASPDDASSTDGAAVDASSDAPTIDAPVDAAAMCPASYLAVAGQPSKYRTVTTPQTWTAAEADCEDDGNGTHLAVVGSMAEDAAVDALTGASIWFGLTDRKVDGTPRWVTGATPTYTNYGGAGNTTAYDCAGIYQSKWAWGECTTLIKYVCECDGVAADPTAY